MPVRKAGPDTPVHSLSYPPHMFASSGFWSSSPPDVGRMDGGLMLGGLANCLPTGVMSEKRARASRAVAWRGRESRKRKDA